jgi:hypothetical protein
LPEAALLALRISARSKALPTPAWRMPGAT